MDRKNRIVAIIQARSGSTRLPNKVNADLHGKTVLQRTVDRVCKSHLIDYVCLAVPYYDWNITKEHPLYVGPEDDVLSRYAKCARELDPEIIVRITADCPLIDPEIIDNTIQYFLDNECDYVSNRLEAPGYPDGQDVEVLTYESLLFAHTYANEKAEREHVTPFIKKMCRCLPYHALHDMLNVRMTLDTMEDYNLINGIVGRLIDKYGETTWNLEQIMEAM